MSARFCSSILYYLKKQQMSLSNGDPMHYQLIRLYPGKNANLCVYYSLRGR